MISWIKALFSKSKATPEGRRPPTLTEITAGLEKSGFRNGDFLVWSKETRVPVSTHFTTQELSCRCSFPTCHGQSIAIELLAKLEKLRQDVKKPLVITSAYRCKAKQQSLRDAGLETASGVSQHELGRAVDISTLGHASLALSASSYFKAIGIARSFIHVDLRSDKARRWTYGS